MDIPYAALLPRLAFPFISAAVGVHMSTAALAHDLTRIYVVPGT